MTSLKKALFLIRVGSGRIYTKQLSGLGGPLLTSNNYNVQCDGNKGY